MSAIRAWRPAGLLCVLATSVSAQSRPNLLPRDREVALALSAGPPHVSERATVYALEGTGYVKVREGTNGFTCLVVRDHPDDLAPVCHDPEGTRAVVPRLLREAELRAQGQSEDAIRSEVAHGLLSGRFGVPRRVGLAYMLSAEARAFDPATGRTFELSPHVMIYAPWVTASDVGASPPGGGTVLTVISEGQFNAYIVMSVPDADRPIPAVTADPVLDALPRRADGQPPPLLPREREMALALSAAPPAVAQRAAVYLLGRGGFVKARDGDNGFTCLVERAGRASLFPICYDAEGSAAILPVSLRSAELMAQGQKDAEMQREIAKGFRSGSFRAPSRAGVAYMLSRDGRFEDASGRVTGWDPHVMFYAPYLRKDDVGAVEEGSYVRRLPTIAGAGEPHAYIIVNVKATPAEGAR